MFKINLFYVQRAMRRVLGHVGQHALRGRAFAVTRALPASRHGRRPPLAARAQRHVAHEAARGQARVDNRAVALFGDGAVVDREARMVRMDLDDG